MSRIKATPLIVHRQAYVEFSSAQAATAVKRKLEALSEDQQAAKKHPVAFTSASSNPYRTLPKDAPVRGKDGPRTDHRASPGHNSPGWVGNSPSQGTPGAGMNNFRGGRGGFNNRGGRGNNMGGFQNRNFPAPMGAGPPMGFQPAPMSGFPGGMMGGMAPFVGFPNRGNMMGGMRGGPGARGGRGGMAPNGMMGGMPNMGGPAPGMMGGMAGPMGPMGPNMNMGPMGAQGMHTFNRQHHHHHAPAATTGGPAGGTAGLTMARVNPTTLVAYQQQGGLLSPISPNTPGGGISYSAYPASSTSFPAASPTTATASSSSSSGAFLRPPPPGAYQQQFAHAQHHHSLSAQPSQAQPHSAKKKNSQLKRAHDTHLGTGAAAAFQQAGGHFNPAFFGGGHQAPAGPALAGAAGGDGNWNPHGTKRQRPE